MCQSSVSSCVLCVCVVSFMNLFLLLEQEAFEIEPDSFDLVKQDLWTADFYETEPKMDGRLPSEESSKPCKALWLPLA